MERSAVTEVSLKKKKKSLKPTKHQNLLSDRGCSSPAYVCSRRQWLTAHGSPWLASGLLEMLLPSGAPGLRECCRVWGWHQPSSEHAAFIL